MSGESEPTQPKVFPAEGGEPEQTIKEASSNPTEALGCQNGGSKESPTSDSEQSLSFEDKLTRSAEALESQNDGSRESPSSDQRDYKAVLAGTALPDTHDNPPGKMLVTPSALHKAPEDENLNRDTTQLVMPEVSQLSLEDKHPATVPQKPPVLEDATTAGASPKTTTEPVQEESSRELREVIEKGKEGKTLTPSESQVLIKEVEHLTERNRDLETTIDFKNKRIIELRDKIENESAQHEDEKRKLEMEVETLEKEVEKLKAEKENLKKKMMSLEDAEYYRTFEAQSERRQDVCVLCRKKENHDEKECWKCGHSHSDHRPKGACTTCKKCNGFMGKKDSEDREICQRCRHHKQNHEMGSCKQCDCSCTEYRALVIAKSHAFPKAVLEMKCEKDKHSIFDGRRYQSKTSTTCWWHQLCTECEDMISSRETKFIDCLKKPVAHNYSPDKQQIRSVDADILLVNTFRALPHSVRLGHYRDCSDCEQYYECIREWVLQASKSILAFKHTPISCEFVEPEDTSCELLFYFLPHPPEGRIVEFPIICNIEIGGNSCLMIYAQIPPFYWAYPLQQVPHEVSSNFLLVVEAMNEELKKKRKEFFDNDESAQRWKQGVQKGLKTIQKEKSEWEEEKKRTYVMEKDFFDSSNTDEGELKDQQEKQQKMFKSLCTLKKKHVPPEELKLVFFFLSRQEHCPRVTLEAPKPMEATFTV